MRTTRFFKTLSIIFICLFLSSCGFKDIDKRLFIQAIGIDHSGNEKKPYKVTLKLAIPSGSLKESGTKYTYLTREGATLAGTIRFLQTHVDKELDFGHLKMIVFGEDFFDDKMIESMDFFIRRRDIQMISWVAVGKPSAEKVLKVEPESEMAGSIALSNIFSNNGVESGYIVSTYLFDARRKTTESGIDLVLPIIKTDKKNTKLMVNRSIIIPNNKKAALKLTSEQTKLFKLMANNITKMNIGVKKKDEKFTMSVDSAKTKYKIITSPQQPPVLKMDVTVTGIIEGSSFDMSPKELDKYSRLAAQKTKKDVLALLKLFQKEDVDPMGFGLRYKATRLQNGNRYEEWKKLYPDMTFDVSVVAKIKSTGTIE